MTVGKSKAMEKYKAGVEAFGGADQYQRCGEKKSEGFLAVAKCLEDARVAALTTDMMAKKYGDAA